MVVQAEPRMQETSDTVVQRLDIDGSALIPTPVTKPLAATEPRRRPRILVVDDQLDILTALELLLKMNGYQTESVDSPSRALTATGGQPFDLVLMDLNYTRDTTSGQEGLALLTELRVDLTSLEMQEPNLERVFLHLTGRALRD